MEHNFNVDRSDFYEYDKPKEITKKRLLEIAEMGMHEVGVAQFGIPGIHSGLYIERVWSFSEIEWNDYITWVKDLVNAKGSKK